MSFADWFGTIGVSILLVAFLLNLLKKISLESRWYTGLNMSGAAIAGFASILLHFWPFIVLESLWTIVSAVAFFNSFAKNK